MKKDLVTSLLQLKQLDLSYKSALLDVFSVTHKQNKVPSCFSVVPTFTEQTDPLQVLPKHYLNNEGVLAWKRVLWVVSQFHSFIKYCPQIVSVVSLLLLYLEEDQTYLVVSRLLSFSKKHNEFIRWHFTLDKRHNLKIAQATADIIQKNSKSLTKALANANLVSLVENMLDSFLVGYFPLSFLERLVFCFVSEGIKVLVRATYTLFYLYKPTIRKEPFEEAKFKEFCNGLQNVDEFFSIAFRARITHKNNTYSSQSVDSSNTDHFLQLYRPSIEFKSSIVNDLDIELIWSKLSPLHNTKTPKLIYTSQRHGFSLSSLLDKASRFPPSSPMLLLVSCDPEAVVGVFIDCSFQVSKTYKGSSESFLFRLRPDTEFWSSSGENEMYAHISKDTLVFGGGGEGPSLMLDSELVNCTSYSSGTFKNSSLNSSFFQCKTIELIALK